ncbi:2-ketoarginine methyltransferase [Saccharopolyspora lacisalsi]|uniref:2-ketoarginine methyltransferase n=1 Tax=Halosaccharopolyspora lacisalsi TaxID=1000566 RepID=A0A839E413_9PSEU|nr:2-ketoarginine methyltransferase [Halosaccharopolyspora lacisalsi]MBA8827780.1 2-ketoarginine methyltransferase [Halosaccharopolyspora lacisalsi]
MGGTFEARLVEALQPIRNFALAQGIYHLFNSGLYERVSSGPIKVIELAEELAFDPQRATGFLQYLANEGIVLLQDECVSLTAAGRELAPFRPWYELLVGGYAETFQQITEALRGPDYATRNGPMIGVGSCGISEYDAFPLVHELMAELPAPPKFITDFGCGDGAFLTGLLESYPSVSGLGVDLFAPAESPVDGIRFLMKNATDYARSLVPATGADRGETLFLAVFLLQEVLEQEGRPAVVELVRTALANGHLAVVEVDYKPTDPSIMKNGLGLGYYNPYNLLHAITEQRLEPEEFWLRLFEEAGAVVVARRTVNSQVDSTGLEIGFLLAPAGNEH